MRALIALATLLLGVGVVAPTAAGAPCPGCADDLAVAAPDMPSTVDMGASGELTWTVANVGRYPSDDVFFGTDLQAGLTLESVDSDAGTCTVTPNVDGNVNCQLGTVAAGQTVTIRARYVAGAMGSGPMVAHAYPASASDRNQTNNQIAPDLTVVAPAGGIGTAQAAAAPERILKSGGVRVRVRPAMAGTFAIDGTIITPTGPVTLTHVDVRDAAAGVPRTVFLGTTPTALAKIRRALRSAKHLRAQITIASGGATATTTLTVQA